MTVVETGVSSIVKFTAVLARPVPLTASLDVMLSFAEGPVTNASLAVTVGAVVRWIGVTGVSVAVLLSNFELVPAAEALDDEAARPLAAPVSRLEIWIARPVFAE
jgi:hypothetical protein